MVNLLTTIHNVDQKHFPASYEVQSDLSAIQISTVTGHLQSKKFSIFICRKSVNISSKNKKVRKVVASNITAKELVVSNVNGQIMYMKYSKPEHTCTVHWKVCNIVTKVINLVAQAQIANLHPPPLTISITNTNRQRQ